MIRRPCVLFNEDNSIFGWDRFTEKSKKEHRVGVWDFKPKARYELHAHVQVFLYSLMLSLRSGISLNRFVCGYFDDEDLYYYFPNEVQITPAESQKFNHKREN